jgi:hypothetical protein
MARRQLIIKKNKTARVTRSEQYIVNSKYLGDEPTPMLIFSEIEYGKALNWYNYMCTLDDAREYIKEFLIKNDRLDQAKLVSKIPDVRVSTTSAWIARMSVREFDLPQSAYDFLELKLKTSLQFVQKTNDDEIKKIEVVSVRDRMKDRASEIIGDIEEMIDINKSLCLYDWLKGNEIPAAYSSMIINHYAPWVQELHDTINNPDDQLKEAYSHLSKKQLKEKYEYIKSIVDDANKYGDVAKKTKAPRKPRSISTEKLLKDFKYQKEDKNYKIASVNPEKIIGAQEVWTFNTKYKFITIIRALDRGGLSVKGTTITKFDEKISVSKATGRKTDEVVTQIATFGKIALKKLLEELKDAYFSTRINENTILLKII